MALFAFGSLVFFLTWWATGRLCTPGSRLFLLDYPNARSLHEVPTPRTGGLAIVASVTFVVVLAALCEVPAKEWWLGGGATLSTPGPWIQGMTLLLALVSFWDDRGGLPVTLRLGIQLVAVVALVSVTGMTLSSIDLPSVGAVRLGIAAVPVTVLFVLWMTNLYNFMDGMDGFAGGMTVIGFGAIAYFAWKGQHAFIFTLSLVISMGAAGFLLYNLPPARIFMGDVGSIPLGFLSGALIVLGVHDGVFDIWIPLLVFSPFVLDATVTVLRRVFRGERIWEAHRTHYYQRLVLYGWGHRKTLGVEYALMVLCVVAALLYQSMTDTGRVALLAIWLLGFAGLAVGVGLMERRAMRPGCTNEG